MSSTGDSRPVAKCQWRQTDVVVNQVGGEICEFITESIARSAMKRKIHVWSLTSCLMENIQMHLSQFFKEPWQLSLSNKYRPNTNISINHFYPSTLLHFIVWKMKANPTCKYNFSLYPFIYKSIQKKVKYILHLWKFHAQCVRHLLYLEASINKRYVLFVTRKTGVRDQISRCFNLCIKTQKAHTSANFWTNNFLLNKDMATSF